MSREALNLRASFAAKDDGRPSTIGVEDTIDNVQTRFREPYGLPHTCGQVEHSLELTGDRAAYESAFRRLARTNLSDLDPPQLLYLLLFTHPTPPERLAAMDAFSQDRR